MIFTSILSSYNVCHPLGIQLCFVDIRHGAQYIWKYLTKVQVIWKFFQVQVLQLKSDKFLYRFNLDTSYLKGNEFH